MMNNTSTRYDALTRLFNERYKSRLEICQQLASQVRKTHKLQTSHQANRAGFKKGINHASIAEIESLAGLTPQQIRQHLVNHMKS